MTNEDHLLINKFFLDNLSEEEKQIFDKRVAEDQELASEVALQKELIELLKVKVKEEKLDVELKQLRKKYDKKTSIISKLPKRWLAAASILLLMSIYLIYLFALKDPTPSIYAQFAQHPTLSLTEMSSDPTFDLTIAEKAFNEGDYVNAKRELEGYLTQNSNDSQASLFLGICHLELGEFQDANVIFKSLENGSSGFKDLGAWYQALCFLKQENYKQSLEVLTRISTDSEKFQQAQKLIEQLRLK